MICLTEAFLGVSNIVNELFCVHMYTILLLKYNQFICIFCNSGTIRMYLRYSFKYLLFTIAYI